MPLPLFSFLSEVEVRITHASYGESLPYLTIGLLWKKMNLEKIYISDV
jgi:hypothetical protein